MEAPRESTFVSIGWSFSAQIAIMVFQLGATVILTRILAPELFGYVAMSATFIAFLSFFSDLGLSYAVITKESLSKTQRSNVFWISTFLGLALSIVAFGGAPLVASFYQHEILKDIVQLQAIVFLLIGLGLLPAAIKKREGQFAPVAKADLTAAFVANLSGVLAGVSGAGIWSIVIIPILQQFLRSFILLVPSLKEIKRPKALSASFELIKFGSYLGAGSILLYFVRNYDDIMIGRFMGAASLAFYTKAYFLVNAITVIPNSSLSAIVISSISKKLQSSRDEAETLFIEKVRLLAFFLFPAGLGASIISQDLVVAVFGHNWQLAGPPLSALALSTFGFTLMASVGWLLVSHKRPKAYLNWIILQTAILVTGFTYFSHTNILTISVFYLIAYGLVLPVPCFIWACKECGHDWRRSLGSLWRIVVSSLVTAVVVGFAYNSYLKPLNSPAFSSALSVIGGVTIYAILSLLLVRPLPVPALEQFRRRLSNK